MQLQNLGNVGKVFLDLKSYASACEATMTAMDFSQIGASLSQFSAEAIAAGASMANLTAEQTAAALAAAGYSSIETAAAMATAGYDAATVAAALSTQGLTTEQIAGAMSATQFTASQIAAALAAQGVGESAIVAALEATGLSSAEASAAVTAGTMATANGAAAVATTGLAASLKAAAAGLATFLLTNPVGWAILAAGAIFGVVKVVDALTESFDEACDKASEARSTYETALNDVKDIQSQQDSLRSKVEELATEHGVTFTDEDTIQTIIDKLKELNLSTTDAQSLSALETTNAQLESQLAIKQKIAEYDQQEAAKAANNVLFEKKRSWGTGEWDVDIYSGTSYEKTQYGNIVDETLSKREKLTSVEKDLTDAYKQQQDLIDSGQDKTSKWWQSATDYEKVTNNIKSLEEQRDSLTSDIKDNLEVISDNYDSLLNENGEALPGFEEEKESIDKLYDSVLDASNANDTLAESEAEASDNASKVSDIYSKATESITQTVDAAMTASQTLVSGITAAQEAIAGQQNGKSISLADFNSDELKDYQGALEYVNGTMQLNAEKVREIAKAKADEQVAINNSNKALEQAKYLENAKQIEQLRASLASASDSEKASIQESIDALLSENSAIADTCKQYDLLSSSIQEAVGSYQNWLNAQNGSDYGDMANDAVSAIQRIRDTYDSNSDVFGDYGSKKFEAAIDFIVPDSVDSDDLGAIESYMADFKQYLKFDDNGAVDGLNIDKFLENSVNAGLMKYSEDDGFQVLGGKKMEDFAEGLNMSSGMVQAFFDELQLKGADFDWGDEAVKTIGDLAVEANEAAESLRQVDGNSDLKIKMDVSDLSTTEEQISALDATIAEMDAVKARPDVDASSIENANSVIQYCLTQKQLLSQPDVMRVDTSQVEGEISNAISLLQQFQTATNDLEIKQKVGADTTEAESKVNSLASEIEGISPDIKAKLDIDSTSVDSIKTSIAGLSAETINVKANVDASAIDGYNPDSKKCDVIYDPKTDALPESFDAINRDVNYVPHTGSLPESFTTLTRYVNYVKTGAVDVNGTAHVSGTAKAGGDWGTAPGGRTLVGELGREIVVDPHTGRWYTVGDNGAEFRDIPAGAIVFNHVQSESLLENGYVAGRASALVSGTALVTGGYKPYKPSSSSTSRTPSKSSSKPSSSSSGSRSSGSSSSRSSSGSSSKSSSSSSSSSEKDFEETFDWIEIAINRISEAIDRVKVKAESAFKTLTKRNNAAAEEISLITDKINTQNSAYTRYMQQANSVGLSSDWQEKVKNGAIDISTITDEDLSDKIKDFQEFYEKAIEAKDAVADLHEEIAQLYANRFSNISTDFDNQLALVQHLTDTYNTGLDTLEAKGLKGSKVYYQALQKAEKENQAILQKELVDLTESFNQAMASGEIEKGSEQWYEMQKSINDVKEAIDESNLSLLEYQKTMRELDWEYFDYMEDRISNITDEADFLIDLMANGKLFDDKGQMTDTGMATMGLHGQNYNVAMAQADQYAEAIKSLNAEIAKDPYNTDLIERRQELLELQQKAILAAEDEKQAMIDLVKDGIEAQLDSLKDLIDAYTDSLDSAKDLYDYQKKVKEQSDEIASLQKQLSAYAGDNSEETKATIQKIQVDLSKAMEELQETEYEQYISDQKKLLDDLYTEYETILNARLDDVDALISDMIDTINTNSSSIADTIKDQCDNVGYTLTESMNSIWTNEGGAATIITKYGEQFLTQNTSTLNAILGIKAYTDALIAKADAEAKAKEEATKKQTEAKKPASQPSKPANNTPSTPSKPARTDKDYYGVALAIWNGNYGWGTGNTRVSRLKAKGFDANRVQSIVNQMGREGYVHSGAWVGRYQGIRDLSPYHYNKYAVGLKHAKMDENAWVNELGNESIVKPTERAIVTHIAKGDSVLDAEATRNIWDMASDPSGFISKNLIGNDILSNVEPYMNVDNSRIDEVTFNLPNVYNYEDFMNRARKDDKFEGMIQAMTVRRLTGGSKFAKSKYKW